MQSTRGGDVRTSSFVVDSLTLLTLRTKKTGLWTWAPTRRGATSTPEAPAAPVARTTAATAAPDYSGRRRSGGGGLGGSSDCLENPLIQRGNQTTERSGRNRRIRGFINLRIFFVMGVQNY